VKSILCLFVVALSGCAPGAMRGASLICVAGSQYLVLQNGATIATKGSCSK
jgi:hypothetical protein